MESAPELMAIDERKLKQVMYNLLSNAVKFTPAGGRIEVGCAIRNEARLLIWVKDTGIGIEPRDLQRIFLPFEQVENSTSRKYQGTGLGLPLASRFIELHGGGIQARSDGRNRGAVFEFFLPIRRVPAAQTAAAS
jgi:signal transduction histidine kinase